MTLGQREHAHAAPRESGQAALLMLGVLAALLAGTLVLFGFGQALGARGKHHAAISPPSRPPR